VRCRRQVSGARQSERRHIADFFCAAVKLIVELDGDSHIGKEAADAESQANLESLGYEVPRFGNAQVYDEPEAVIEAVWQACTDRAVDRG